MRVILAVILLNFCANAGIIRLSLVAPSETSGYSRYERGTDGNKSAIFVKDEGFITEADVALAMPSFNQADSVDVTLSPEGERKMKAATTPMRPGIDRIAILVDGKILSAPTIQAVPLGKNFQINGLRSQDEPATLAGRLMGKSEGKVKLEIAEEKERLRNLPKPPPPVYYTDKEYEVVRKQREKIGLNYMDRNYTEKELGDLLQISMTEEKVISIFGKPIRILNDESGKKTLAFETAPEKFPESRDRHLDMFICEFSSGKLTAWNPCGYSARPREPKRIEPKPGNLLISYPAPDMSAANFNPIIYFESLKISIKSGMTGPNDIDYYQLIGILWSLASSGDEKSLLDTRCDLFSTLAQKLPELAVLSKEAKSGKIKVSVLRGPLEPYVAGKKPLP